MSETQAEMAQTDTPAETAEQADAGLAASETQAGASDERVRLEQEIARLQKRIKELNAESAERRVNNKTLQEQLAAIQQMLEDERNARLEAERKAQEAKRAAERAKAVSDLAAKYGLPPAVAERLTGETPEELEADAQKLAAELATLGRGAAKGVTPSPANSTWSSSLTLETIRNMTPEQINERWDEVQRILSGS